MRKARESRPWQRAAASSTAIKNKHILRASATLLAEPLHVIVKGGPGLPEALRTLGYKPVWSGSVGGVILDRHRRGCDRLPDLDAGLSSLGFKVRVIEAGEVR